MTRRLALVLLLILPLGHTWAAQTPLYKPSSRSPEPIDITTNAYGASRNAPNALSIGDPVPAFSVPRAGGGVVALQQALSRGDVVLVFYRGHW